MRILKIHPLAIGLIVIILLLGILFRFTNILVLDILRWLGVSVVLGSKIRFWLRYNYSDDYIGCIILILIHKIESNKYLINLKPYTVLPKVEKLEELIESSKRIGRILQHIYTERLHNVISKEEAYWVLDSPELKDLILLNNKTVEEIIYLHKKGLIAPNSYDSRGELMTRRLQLIAYDDAIRKWELLKS